MPTADDLLGPPPVKAKPTANDLLGPPPASAPAKPTSRYMDQAAFRTRMDEVYGAGRWRETSGYRTAAQEDSLRAQGAGMNRPGTVDPHTQGGPDDPGAYDIVVPGMNARQAAQRLRDANFQAHQIYPEAAHGTQGEHLHIGMNPESAASARAKPTANDLLGPPPKPTAEALLGPAPAKAAAPTKKGAPMSGGVGVQTPAKTPGLYERFSQDERERQDAALAEIREGVEQGRVPEGEAGDPMNEAAALYHGVSGAAGWVLSGPEAVIDSTLGRATEAATANAPHGRIGGVEYDTRLPKTFPADAAATVGSFAAGGEGAGPREALTPREAGAVDRFEPPPIAPGRTASERARIEAASRVPPAKTPVGAPKRARAESGRLDARVERNQDATLDKPPTSLDAIRDTASGAKKAVQSTFAASTMTDAARDTAAIVRRSGGRRDAFHAQIARKLLAYDKTIGRLSVADSRALVDYIEGNGPAPKDPHLKEAADAISGAYKSYRNEIGNVLEEHDRPHFLENYYSHMWKEKPSVVVDRMNQFSRQGSGRSFKARTIPTIKEGIEAGLTPRSENPIEVTMAYSGNMARYLKTLDVQGAMQKDGLASKFTPGQQPEGWVPLNGIRTRDGALAVQDADKDIVARRPEKLLYAPEEAARIYNRSIDLGFEKGDTGPWYRGLRRMANGASQLVLGLSGYHATAETAHALFSEIARGGQAALRGDFKQAGKSLANSATVVGPAIGSAIKGGALRKQVLSSEGFDSLPAAARAYIDAGGRVKMDKLYSSSSGRTAYQAGKYDLVDAYRAQKQAKGFAAKTKAAFDAVLHGSTALEMQRFREGVMSGTAIERGKKVASLLPNALQSVMGPLFEDYIPNLKAGAFAKRYEDWLRQNPEAGDAMQESFARKLSDHVDNRFGEMVQDNLFMAQQLKQTAQIAALAPGWDIGLLRELAGGVLDVPKSAKMLFQGKGITENTAYLVSLLVGAAYVNGVATYLKTGKMPGLDDLQSYPTGGTNAYGDDERASIPGQQKDVYAQINALTQFATTGDPEAEEQLIKNKIDPAAAFGFDVATNSNWHGDAIFKGPGVEAQDGDKNLLGRDAMNRFAPLIFSSMKGSPGSNISSVEKLMGVRPAPFDITNPQGYQDWLASKGQKKYDAAQSAARREDGDQ